MIIGMNTDVTHRGEVFHVQTEDLAGQTSLESVVFLRGRTLQTVRKAYEAGMEASPDTLRERLVSQHRTVIGAILKDRFAEAVRRLGALGERLRLVSTELEETRAGKQASLLLLLRAEPSGRPVADAAISCVLTRPGQAGSEVYRGRTDARGFHLANVAVPADAGAGAQLLMRARSELGEAETSFAILERGAGEQQTPAERPNLIVSELEDLRPGSEATLLILLRGESTGRAIPKAEIRVDHVVGESAHRLHLGSTDGRGFHLAEFPIPATAPADSQILVQAFCPQGTSEVMLPVLR